MRRRRKSSFGLDDSAHVFKANDELRNLRRDITKVYSDAKNGRCEESVKGFVEASKKYRRAQTHANAISNDDKQLYTAGKVHAYADELESSKDAIMKWCMFKRPRTPSIFEDD